MFKQDDSDEPLRRALFLREDILCPKVLPVEGARYYAMNMGTIFSMVVKAF